MVTVVRMTSVIGTPVVQYVRHEVVTEHLYRRMDRRGDRRTQDADRGLLGWPRETGCDVVTEVEQQIDVLHATTAVFHPIHRALDPPRSFSTGRALAAGLAREELRDAPR